MSRRGPIIEFGSPSEAHMEHASRLILGLLTSLTIHQNGPGQLDDDKRVLTDLGEASFDHNELVRILSTATSMSTRIICGLLCHIELDHRGISCGDVPGDRAPEWLMVEVRKSAAEILESMREAARDE